MYLIGLVIAGLVLLWWLIWVVVLVLMEDQEV